MRLFIAIDMPDDVKRVLSGLRRDIPGVRWVPPEQMHLTLLFLGEVPEERLEILCCALSTIEIFPFTLNFSRTGCFPRPSSPRVLWAGVDRQPVLTELAQRVRKATESCGIQIDERAFSPHITLARIKQPASCNVFDFINRPVSDNKLSVPVQHFTLYQSCLTQHGAIHKEIMVFSKIPTER
jgi:2'-5' RNA ligase